MDESLQEFEVELKGLAPQCVAPRLMNRIANELAAPVVKLADSPGHEAPPGNRSIAWRWLSIGAVGIAAALTMVVAIIRSPGDKKSAGLTVPGIAATKTMPSHRAPADGLVSDDAFKAVAAANFLYDMKDEGLVTAKSGTSERRVRFRYVDTYTWKNPRNNASLTWSVPRDEIRVQPVQFN